MTIPVACKKPEKDKAERAAVPRAPREAPLVEVEVRARCRIAGTILELHREKIAVEWKMSPKEIYPYGFQGHDSGSGSGGWRGQFWGLARGRATCRYVLEECCSSADPPEKNNVV